MTTSTAVCYRKLATRHIPGSSCMSKTTLAIAMNRSWARYWWTSTFMEPVLNIGLQGYGPSMLF